jgi:hypothetical protein
MITKVNREVFITEDGKEFEDEAVALKYEIKCALDNAEGVYLQSYQFEPVINALLAKFTITPINHETKELS